MDFSERRIREGMMIYSTALNPDPATFPSEQPAAPGQHYNPDYVVPTGFADYIESAVLSANRKCVMCVIFYEEQLYQPGAFPRMVLGPQVGKWQSVSVPVKLLLRSSLLALVQTYVRNVYVEDSGDTLDGFAPSLSLTGTRLTDDFNYGADKVILCTGESPWAGVAATNATHVPWQIRQFYAQRGQNVRHVNFSISGTTSNTDAVMIDDGRFDVDDVALIADCKQINDAIQGNSPSTYRTNINKKIAWKQSRYPLAKMVIFGETPLADNTNEAALAAIRAQAAAAVTAANDPNIFYYSLGEAFDRTNSANYAGDGIHCSTAGFNQVLNGGYGTFIGIRAWLAANIPALPDLT